MWSNRQKRIGKRHLECTLAALALLLALGTLAQASPLVLLTLVAAVKLALHSLLPRWVVKYQTCTHRTESTLR